MANIVRWNPYEELQRMRDEFTRAIGPVLGWGEREVMSGEWAPSVDVKETSDGYHVSAEVPGVNPADIDVRVFEDGLTLRGNVQERSESQETGFRRIERRYGSFQRRISFPTPVQHEQARAEYHNGVLEIHVPKAAPAQGNSTRLEISPGGSDDRSTLKQ